jgi:hypothetical protein
MPAVRATLAAWLAEAGGEFYRHMIAVGKQPMRPPGPAHLAAVELARQERARVRDGGLYWVDPAMTALAVHAGAQLPFHEIYAHDLPSERGFIVFAEPIGSYRNIHGDMARIVAASWGPFTDPDEAWTGGGVWITFYADLAHLPYPGRARQLAVDLDCGVRLLPDNEAGWPFGLLCDGDVPADSTGVWAQTVCAAWLLMAQPLTQTTVERPPAPVRQRLRRAGQAVGEVQLVHVRRRTPRPSTTDRSARAAVAHEHQWWVGGHWRRYHCGPGRTRVERRYIAPHLAGPDDKPVRGTQRVLVWDR